MSQEEAAPAIGPLDVRRVMAALPHRYPMLLVDRVERIIPDQSITATKAVTINEGFFQGHFPDRPIMPGVLIVEALAQAAGVLAVESLGLAGSGKLVYFMAIDGAKFQVKEAILQSFDWGVWAAFMATGSTPGYRVTSHGYKCSPGGLGYNCRGTSTICKTG